MTTLAAARTKARVASKEASPGSRSAPRGAWCASPWAFPGASCVNEPCTPFPGAVCDSWAGKESRWVARLIRETPHGTDLPLAQASIVPMLTIKAPERWRPFNGHDLEQEALMSPIHSHGCIGKEEVLLNSS